METTPLALCRRHFLQVGIAAQRSALGTRPPQWLPMSDWRSSQRKACGIASLRDANANA
ncbi:hypothetical protein I8751_19865 [Nostocaceae cyanobacterium CENA357]|uniref:Uncharacterized protein n=1 Tax=Atlanticothrix silvestris CENA357 TaxID=1725252 RepID=A0A8J7HH58_9CYAN|nr:hypothetical protein [Atlanticothrix silvestris CENA357]